MRSLYKRPSAEFTQMGILYNELPSLKNWKINLTDQRGRVNLHRPNIFMLEEIHYTLARAVMVHSHHRVIICIYMGKGEDYSTYLLNFHHA